MKLTGGSRWNMWVTTNIHLDHSSPLRKRWSPLRAKPLWGEQISVEPTPWWTTCPSEGVDLLWQLDTDVSFVGECSWSMRPWFDQWWPVPCSPGWALLMWVVLQCHMCPTTVESMAKGSLHWTMGADQGTVGCWARRHCHQQPWWWCMTISEWTKLTVGSNKVVLLQM